MAEVVEDPQQQPQPQQQQPQPQSVPPSAAAEDDKPTPKDPDSSSSSSSPPPPASAATATATAPLISSFSSLSLSIWPPSQRTRTAVFNRLVETLSSPSVLSQRYGSLPNDEASSVARHIEEEAFSLASSSPSPDDDGMGTLQIYSREISKRMLDAIKSRATTASPAPAEPAASDPAPAGEETASVVSESSQA